MIVKRYCYPPPTADGKETLFYIAETDADVEELEARCEEGILRPHALTTQRSAHLSSQPWFNGSSSKRFEDAARSTERGV